MAPLASTASLAKTFGAARRRGVTRRARMAEAELGVRPRDNKITRQHHLKSMVNFRFGEISSSESGQLPARRALHLGEWSRSPASAFTLIEMVVVILIIAILAGLVMGAATAVFDNARKAQAKNDVIQIATAVNAFYTEYGRYPVNITAPANDAFFGTGTAPAGSTTYGNNDVLLDVLRSNTDPSGPNLANVNLFNPRRIVFLAPSSAKATTPPRGGIALDRRYYDPWGSQYAVQIDTNYDNTISNPYSDTDGSAGTNPLRQGVIAYSYGKNGKLGGGTGSAGFSPEGGSAGAFKSSSDVVSW